MEKIFLLDTAVFSDNKGDEIIMNSINDYFRETFKPFFVVQGSTHLPVSNILERFKANSMINRTIKESKYSFACGTNLLAKGLEFGLRNSWKIDFINTGNLSDIILLGCGLSGKSKNRFYTKHLYNRVLSQSVIHSVRDSKTKEFVESLGLKAINTGCPTTWKLTPKHCADIPHIKAESVVFTLTDYHSDYTKDGKLIDLLLNSYKNVAFWVQGFYDYKYLQSFPQAKNVSIINPDVMSFGNHLLNNDVDYVGTRLHAGIKAMQCKKRSIILSIDNRAEDITRDINLPCIERQKISILPEMINSTFETKLDVNFEGINEWLNQFEFYR